MRQKAFLVTLVGEDVVAYTLALINVKEATGVVSGVAASVTLVINGELLWMTMRHSARSSGICLIY